jgi:hypothetical protein
MIIVRDKMALLEPLTSSWQVEIQLKKGCNILLLTASSKTIAVTTEVYFVVIKFYCFYVW